MGKPRRSTTRDSGGRNQHDHMSSGAAETDIAIVLAEFFARRPTAAEIASFQLPAALIARADELGERAQAGTLSPDERRALDELLWAGDLLTLTKLSSELAVRDGDATAHSSTDSASA